MKSLQDLKISPVLRIHPALRIHGIDQNLLINQNKRNLNQDNFLLKRQQQDSLDTRIDGE